MEKKYTITTDLCARNSKPLTGYEKSQIYQNLKNQYEVTITDFGKIVSQPLGYTWSGGLFDGLCSNNTWISQSVIGLDFDDGLIMPDQVIERLKQFGIVPQLWYTTFRSNNDLIKFRMVLFLDEPIVNKPVYEFVITRLLKIFPEADKSCKDFKRFFFGGISSTIIHTDSISVIHLINALAIELYASDSNSFRKLPSVVIQYIKERSAEFPHILYSRSLLSIKYLYVNKISP